MARQITREYFKGLNHIATVFPKDIPMGCGLVYAGDKKQQRTDVLIVPVTHLEDLFSLSGE